MNKNKIANSHTLDKDVIEWLTKKAAETDRSVSYVLNDAVRQLMEKEKK